MVEFEGGDLLSPSPSVNPSGRSRSHRAGSIATCRLELSTRHRHPPVRASGGGQRPSSRDSSYTAHTAHTLMQRWEAWARRQKESTVRT